MQLQLQRLRAKMTLIVDRYTAMERRLARERESVSELKATLLARQADIERLERENEYLRMVRSVDLDPQALRKAKVLITKLVRDIDRCIRDIND